MSRLTKALKRAKIPDPETVADLLMDDQLPTDPNTLTKLIAAGLIEMKPTPTDKLADLTQDVWEQFERMNSPPKETTATKKPKQPNKTNTIKTTRKKRS
jgi:hypothetical protein